MIKKNNLYVPSNNMKMIYFIRKVNMPCSEHEICVSCELTFTIKYAILNIYISGKQFFNHSVIWFPIWIKKLVERRIDGEYSFHHIQKGACACSKWQTTDPWQNWICWTIFSLMPYWIIRSMEGNFVGSFVSV